MTLQSILLNKKDYYYNIYDSHIARCILEKGDIFIKINLGRCSYKSSYILERCGPKDVIVTLPPMCYEFINILKSQQKQIPTILSMSNFDNIIKGRKFSNNIFWFDEIGYHDVNYCISKLRQNKCEQLCRFISFGD